MNNVSELKIMRSAAGWYIGRTCMDDERPDMPMPYSRESDYYTTEKEAESILALKWPSGSPPPKLGVNR